MTTLAPRPVPVGHRVFRSWRISRVSPFSLLALGLTLARRGILASLAIAICALTTLVGCVVAAIVARRGEGAPVHTVPILTSSALAWGGGFLLAFGSAAHALRRDRELGIQHLLVARTTSLRAYVLARIGGLAALLAIVVAGGTLMTGIVAVLASARVGLVPSTLQATVASFVFALAFSVVVAPLAFAALGARSRVGGYFFMLFVIVLPEIVAAVLSNVVPVSVTEVLSIPSALATVRSALSPGTTDLVRLVRALVALAIWLALTTTLVRRIAMMLDRGGEENA